MNKAILLRPGTVSGQLAAMIDTVLGMGDFETYHYTGELPCLKATKLVLAVELDNSGNSVEVFSFISRLYEMDSDSLSGSSAMLLIHSPNELHTKSNAANIIFQLNQLGCRFYGHPVVEATGSLNNFLTWHKTIYKPLEDICLDICRSAATHFISSSTRKYENPDILVLHSSAAETSNTLALWKMVKEHINGCKITELHVENGKILDCNGCSFRTCIHYSSQRSCFYGGAMVEDIYPAIEKADAIIWLCPNYNDSVSANLMAVINRMTALYRRIPFYNKSFYSIIVSGNSGGDSVAKQLIGSLCINKGFVLPPKACLFATANDPEAIYSVPCIREKAAEFACSIMEDIKG